MHNYFILDCFASRVCLPPPLESQKDVHATHMRVITAWNEENITVHRNTAAFMIFFGLKSALKSITKDGEVVCAWSTSGDILFNFLSLLWPQKITKKCLLYEMHEIHKKYIEYVHGE